LGSQLDEKRVSGPKNEATQTFGRMRHDLLILLHDHTSLSNQILEGGALPEKN
jgi:hypothetical protein